MDIIYQDKSVVRGQDKCCVLFSETGRMLSIIQHFFDNSYLGDWLKDEFAQKMIKSVDKATVLGANAIESKALGVLPVTGLSGGTKTLLLIYNYPKKYSTRRPVATIAHHGSCASQNAARAILQSISIISWTLTTESLKS